ncbi:polycystin-1 [Etheostoma spectabile]|uniref:polycystin-1 n=1 Tax=Etheostoma spectabile TaxID=54343 RepID=UPI0013AFD114|nr:polycystin-1-like [Etheostoma spectabile]
MTGTLRTLKQRLWILCGLLITVAGEDIPCPKGGLIHLTSRRCYWLSETTSSQPEAQDSCRETRGGDLASADSLELQHFIHHSFPVNSTVWVWLKGSAGEGSVQVGVAEPVNPAWWTGASESQGGCSQMALGTQRQWRKAQCAGQYLFLCEKQVTESLPSVDNYLTGLTLMSGIYAQTQIHPFPNVPDIGALTVEMQLFPGLWFSHAGQLASVELVVQPSPVSSLARVQILRPYCNPNHHLVPPGCSSLLNPFSCCSAVPLCNTTGGCSLGQHWCHLLEACVPTTSPCSPYDSAAGARGFALPPRYPAIPPFYHLVADLPLRVNPSSELKTISLLLPERAIMVYPDDVVAIQHTRDSGAFLHCLNSEASLNSPWRQSYMSLRRKEWGGWWEGGLTSLPHGGQWVDGVVCDLRMLYVDKNLHRGTEHDEDSGFTHREATAAPDNRVLTTGPTPCLRSEFGLNVIHPVPDENNQIHVQINVPTLIVVKVLSGEKARSSWSAPVLQTGVHFLPSCPEEVALSWPDCWRQSPDAWFSSVILVLPSAGVQTLNISVMDAVSSQTVSVRVCGYEAVTGLTVEQHGCQRMLVDTSQSFQAKVESGSAVKFTWVIDDLEEFAYEGESYSVVFKKPAKYKLRLTASNHVSSQSQQVLLTADEITPLGEPEFLLVREVIAVDATHLYTLRVKVDISLPVTFRWDFGDGSSKVIHTQSAPCQNMEGLMERGGKHVYVQDSVNYTFSIPADYTLHVQVSNQYEKTDATMKISVRPRLKHLLISPSPPVPLVEQTLILEASTEPSTHAVVYTWDFADGSEVIQGIHCKVNHTFASAGVYNLTVCANNTLTFLTTWLMMEVLEKISGLTVSYNGPTELSSATDFRATVATGTNLLWNFDFGDGSRQGNVTDGSISHIYKSPGHYTVDVTVLNSVSQAHQSLCVEVYRLAVSGVLPTECVMSGRDIQFTALVKGNISILTFHWLFGDGSPLAVLTGQSTAMHTFQSQGIFHISLTVFGSVTSVSFNKSICVEAPITNITVQSSKEVVAVGDEVCVMVLVSPVQIRGYQFKWVSSPSSITAMTETNQKCFIFKEKGVEEVSVTALNEVSNKTATARITIQNPVSKLSVDSQSGTLTVNTLASFWVASCTGSNVSVLWDFGDGSPVETKQNVSHAFTSTGQYTVTVTAFNAVSRDSVSLKVNVLLPISDLSLHTNQPYAIVGEETLISAISSVLSSTNYYWTVDGLNSTKQGTYQFRFAFLKPGMYQVRVVAQNLVSRKEAAILIEAFESIEGLQIECQSLTNMKYIPTQEELLFIASITKGSNVSYHWLALRSGINRQITSDGELFHMLVETPGGVSVELRASNKLGEATSIVHLVSVQRVAGAHITTQSNIVALGELVNISVSVVTGSDLHYLWYVKSDLSPLKTHTPFLLHTFTSVGHCLVRVSAQNVLSHSNFTKEFNVQEEIQEMDFEIERKTHPFQITTSSAVQLHGLIRKGSDLHWNWEIRGAVLFNYTNQTFIYTFPLAGIYQVSLNVSNGINWQMVSHSVTVQDAIKGLMLNIWKSTFCTEEPVTVIPTISKGSNVSFAITFRNKDWIHSQGIRKGQFTTSSLPAGTHLVTLKGWNQVSSAEVSSSILVAEHIQGLRLVNCCADALEAQKRIQFRAEVQSGLPVNYTWIFHLVGSEPTWLKGQEVIFTPPQNGLLTFSVLATNGICSNMVNATAIVQWPVKKVKLVCHSERIFVGYSVRFSVKVNEGSNPKYLWDFGDSTEALVTDLSTVNHSYYIPGKYSVMVKVLNSVSHVSTVLDMEVEEPQCSRPQASLVQSQSTIFRSRPSFFEASMDITCSAYKATYLWEIFKESDCTNLEFSGNKVVLRSQVDATSPFLLLPKHTLDVGQYCLVFSVSLQGTPLLAQQKTSVTVVHSMLVAVIKGGSHRLWPSLSDLVLDGSESEDPDVAPGVEDILQYHWTFMTVNSTESHFPKAIGSNSSIMTVLSTQLHSDTVYVFSLTVHKAGRRPASVNQTVTVCDAPVLPVIVECVSCSVLSSAHHVSYNAPIILSGQCGQCDDQAQYIWSAEDQTGITLSLNTVSTSTGRHSSNLVVRSGVLQPGQSYTFTLNVSQPGRGQWGSASLTLLPNNPPHGGLCDLSPESDIHLLETVVTYNCSGWRDDESRASQLIYTFQVAPSQPIGTLLTLYRGTRSTFGTLVPIGSPGQERSMSVITVTLLVEDHLGAKVIALNRMLTVDNPAKDGEASQWLRIKSQTELWALVQHGNPQEIIPYSIALTSQLNQMEPVRTAVELMDRREIRENVAQALASLPVSSLLHVDQISSALSLATAVPSELVCEKCQQKVLEAVGKMIHVMEEQMSLGVLSAVETGKNILNILGSILAAVSESVSASRSHPAHTRTLQSDSTTAQSALGHAGALMRSLMRSRVHGEAPLSLSTDYINTVGFHGDPSDLLCSPQSNQNQIIPSESSSADALKSSRPCPFHIPSSLTAHLKSQKLDVVQILFGMDAELGSNPLLTGAVPPISTALVAMELSTPQGQPIPIQDLDMERAIRVTLPNKYPVGQSDGREGEAGNGTCLTVNLSTEGRLNLTVKAVDELGENAGLFISFNFSLDPGAATPAILGRVKIEVSSTVPGTNASQNSLVRELTLTLSAPTTSTEETIFLSPLLDRTDKPLSVNLTWSLADGCPVQVSVCVFSSLCQYYSVKERRWSSEGLQPLEGSTLHSARCLTQHLTMFGASVFIHPGAVVLLPPPGGPVRNVLVGIVCAVLVLIHLLAGLIAHKLDHLDSLRLSQVPLCGQAGLYHYRVLVKTGRRTGAGTTAHVGISLYGVNKSGSRHLQRGGAFQRGSLDQFHLETDDNLGDVWKIRIWHDNTGLDPSWYVEHVVVWDPQTDNMFIFLLEDWLSVENQKNGSVEKEVLASCPEELSQFGRVFTSQMMFGMVEDHLWLSLWERPAHSRFTRGQRVTCSALTLHLYLALGALWYGAVGTEGHSGPVSAQLLVTWEAVVVGMSVAVLVFPLQCFLCFLFRKAHSQVTLDTSVPPSPVCHSVEMDVYLGQSGLSGPSFLSLPDSSNLVQDSPSSLLESKGLDSSILDFWAASGLVPRTGGAFQEEGIATWPSCDSVLDPPVGPCLTKTSPALSLCKASLALGPVRQLRRKKALMQLCLASPSSTGSPTALISPLYTYPLSKETSSSHRSPATLDQKVSTMNATLEAQNHNLTTLLTLSEEDLLMSIAAAADNTAEITNSNSDSGWDSPRTTSSLSPTRSSSYSSWSERSEESLHGAEIYKPAPQSCLSPHVAGLYRCPSVLSVDSVASTFLPSPSPDSTRSSSTTRIGVARHQPSWLLPPWALCVIYPLVALLLGACLAVAGLYGSFLSRTVVLMWLESALSAFLTSALLLEPLKVCVLALISTVLWRPVDPEVEEQLAQEATVVRAFGEHGGKVRPPCGYGLLQAKEEARKVRALRSLMKHCVCQLLLLLLVLMVNYQASVEQGQGRLLHSSVRRHLHTAPSGVPNLTSLRHWSDAEQWINDTLVLHLHQNPTLRLVGLPRLQYSHTLRPLARVSLGNSSVTTQQLLADLHMADWSQKQFKTLSVDFTHYHRESGLFVCVSIQLEWTQTQRVVPFLFIHPILIPSSFPGLDPQVPLTVLLLISALLILLGELWSVATERAQYLCQCRHWFQLLLALLSLATAILQLCFLSQGTSCVSKSIELPLLCVPAAGNLAVCAEVGGVGQSAAESLEAAVGSDGPADFAAAALRSPRKHVEGFLSVRQTGVSVLSILRGRMALQRLCRVHPVLGPLYGLLLMGGGFWLLARLCGAVLIRTYRAEQTELYRPTIEPQDYEMVEFFIKRLKLWMGLTKPKEFRHRVKFQGMGIPPSRSLQESRLSTMSSTLPSSHSPSLSSSFSSPRPLSSALSTRSEDSSVSEPGLDVQSSLDRLLPCVSALLSRFDQVNQITEDIHNLEIKLEEAQTRRRKKQSNRYTGAERFQEPAKPKELEGETGEVRLRKTGFLYPKPRISLPSSFSFAPCTLHSSAALVGTFRRTRRTYSESESASLQPQGSGNNYASEAAKLASGVSAVNPAGSLGYARFPRRRAWHSGSSHSADASQRVFQAQGEAAPCGNGGEYLAFTNTRPRSEEGVRGHINDGVPVKRKAWTEQD